MLHVPPQSTSVSVPFCFPSEQEGWAQVKAPGVQTPLSQSRASRQARPLTHLGQFPPQSVADSLPFFTPSLQAAAMHWNWVQTRLTQSSATSQTLKSTHLLGQELPQSMSGSCPFLTLSLQDGT